MQNQCAEDCFLRSRDKQIDMVHERAFLYTRVHGKHTFQLNNIEFSAILFFFFFNEKEEILLLPIAFDER